MKLAVYCADVGSIKWGRFGWAGTLEDGSRPLRGTDIEEFAERVRRDLDAGAKVALGFECPLFVPLRAEPKELLKARAGRPGEGSRPWSASAGTASLATGLVQVSWVLSRLRETVSVEPPLFLCGSEFEKADSGLLVWEALVAGRGKPASTRLDGNRHVQDAETAVEAFLKWMPRPWYGNIIDEGHVFSLVAAAALAAGWREASRLINKPCIVVSPAHEPGC